MSSELSTIIVVGPIKLKSDKRLVARVIKRAKELQQEIQEALEEGDDIAVTDSNWLSRDEMEDTVALNPKAVLTELARLWNGLDTHSDVNMREAMVGTKRIRIVVAGDTSYGDEPEGDGFRVLLAAERLGMFPLLGLG